MAKCKAQTRKGARCTNYAGSSGYCFTHDPSRGVERAQARSKGGQHGAIAHAGDVSKLPSTVKTVDDVLAVLDYTMAEMLVQENGIVRARALISLALAYLKGLEVGEIEERLEAIEVALKGDAR